MKKRERIRSVARYLLGQTVGRSLTLTWAALASAAVLAGLVFLEGTVACYEGENTIGGVLLLTPLGAAALMLGALSLCAISVLILIAEPPTPLLSTKTFGVIASLTGAYPAYIISSSRYIVIPFGQVSAGLLQLILLLLSSMICLGLTALDLTRGCVTLRREPTVEGLAWRVAHMEDSVMFREHPRLRPLARALVYARGNPGCSLIIAFELLLMTCAGLLVLGMNLSAEHLAVYAYYCLLAGVALQLVTFFTQREDD